MRSQEMEESCVSRGGGEDVLRGRPDRWTFIGLPYTGLRPVPGNSMLD